MKLLAITLLAYSGLASAQVVQSAEPTARDLHAASCVAALDVNTQDLAEQVKAGKEASRALLLDRLVSGAAFIGDAYLHGDSDEHQARELADQARETQKRLSAKELAARQAACADEGMKLYAAGNGLQRAIVKRVAQKRMDKLLGA